MNNLSINTLTNKKELTISSREIAELCNKRHDNVLQICRELKAKSISPKIQEIKSIDKLGRSYPEFLLNKRDSLVLVARLSPEFTAAVIDRWQELEKQTAFKLPSNYIEALEQLTQEVKEKTVLEQKLLEVKPKVAYLEQILQSKSLVNINQIAKDYGYSARGFNQMLADLKIQYKQNGQWLLFADYHNKGYTHSNTIDITHKDGTTTVSMYTMWTQKGRMFLYNKLKHNGILPLIETENALQLTN